MTADPDHDALLATIAADIRMADPSERPIEAWARIALAFALQSSPEDADVLLGRLHDLGFDIVRRPELLTEIE